ncbi:SPOSA6832_04101, partial [Sporobolomyces salmonicolor]
MPATSPASASPSAPVDLPNRSDPGALSGRVAEQGADAVKDHPTGLRGFVQSALDSNPYFSAGFGLMALGVGAQVLRRSAVYGATIAQRRLLVSLEISSKDPSYPWFLQWMSQQSARQAQLADKPLRGIEGLASRIRSHELAVETKYEQRKDGSSTAEFSLVPGPGTHYFRYQNAWFQVSPSVLINLRISNSPSHLKPAPPPPLPHQVKRERATNMLDLNSGTPWETVHLTTLSRDRDLFPALLSEARQLAQQAQVGRTVIYTAWGAEWRPFGRPREKRLLESIPYRRGYLLYGPPGSGKSSFIQALAGSLDYNICVLNLSERGLTDDKLNHLLANAPERSIVLLEDIDAAFSMRQQTGEAGFNSNVTFSGLLNALDGVASSTSQRLLFLTTNHLEKLDPALIRPGRVDLKELIDDATPYQTAELFHRFYHDEEGLSGEEAERLKRELVEKVEEGIRDGVRVSMAALQGHFIRNDAKGAVAGWEELRRVAEEDQQRRLRDAAQDVERVRFASSP